MGLNVKFSQVTQGTAKGHLFNKHFAGYIKGAFPWGRGKVLGENVVVWSDTVYGRLHAIGGARAEYI